MYKNKFNLRNVIAIAICLAGTVFMTINAQSVDVYAAGYEQTEDGKYVSKVWKNGEVLYNLTTINDYAFTINSIFVLGNDVYVAGTDSKRISSSSFQFSAKLWKNGEELYSLNNARFEDIHISGEDIYIAGIEYITSTKKIGKVWKNNEVLYSLTNNSDGPYIFAMCVSDNDIYVCGRTQNSYGIYIATVWKNGSQLFTYSPISTSGNIWSDAFDIDVSNNSVYVSGYSGFSGFDPIIYKYDGNNNNVIYSYPPEGHIATPTYVYSIDVVGNDVYAVRTQPHLTHTDKVFKNSFELYSFANTNITDISVKNNDVYLVGYDESNTAKVWKNGEELFALTNGMYEAQASSIFVIEHGNIGINEISADTENAIETGYFDILGRKLTEEPTKGVYIIRYNNGTTKKMMK